MKTSDKSLKKNGYPSDDDNIRYKINLDYFNNGNKSPTKIVKKVDKSKVEDDEVRYKFPTVSTKPKVEQKLKPKPKIKVNFWSSKTTGSRLHNTESTKTKRRHTVAASAEDTTAMKPKSSGVKVRKRVSFLPSPLFSDNHVPMVTVPDDLTIQLNEEEANDLGEDLNLAFVNSGSSNGDSGNTSKRRPKNSSLPSSPKNNKRKRSFDDVLPKAISPNPGHENELEFFSKYIVQKLRRMETNQRIYSENLINTVLMLGQLGQLNVKSKITEASQ
ncbi:uncharacterized protein LOC128671070 [Plodia interpunctella]|uniref:uncharacterized protein LOC128671070 n=1 Tax=Plodia interpunctella TaxID=58824 RepID=UPI002368B2A1|nr:uncharacterized protein LOC128671070 [Plodia interpunctella]